MERDFAEEWRNSIVQIKERTAGSSREASTVTKSRCHERELREVGLVLEQRESRKSERAKLGRMKGYPDSRRS
jgi:hypothetical protein